MDKDLDEAAWRRIGNVVPVETLKARGEKPRTVFSLEAIIGAFEEALAPTRFTWRRLSLPHGDIAHVPEPQEEGRQPEFARFIIRPGGFQSWLDFREWANERGLACEVLLSEHRVLHSWLESCGLERRFSEDSRVPFYIGNFLDKPESRVPSVPKEPEASRQMLAKFDGDLEELLTQELVEPTRLPLTEEEEHFCTGLDEHNDEHRMFQLWLIFREATCLLFSEGRRFPETFPEWMIKDLDHLVGQGRYDLRRGRDVAKPVLPTKGPPMWAAEILNYAHGKQALPDLPVTLCKLCKLPFEERRRGRPSPNCLHCRPLARERNERARRKAKRRSKSVLGGV